METRAVAVSALAAVAQELYPAQPPGTAPCACARLQNGHAAGAVSSTDKGAAHSTWGWVAVSETLQAQPGLWSPRTRSV